MRQWLSRLSLHAKLMLLLLAVATICMGIVFLLSVVQFHNRARELADTLYPASLTTVLNVAGVRHSTDEIKSAATDPEVAVDLNAYFARVVPVIFPTGGLMAHAIPNGDGSYTFVASSDPELVGQTYTPVGPDKQPVYISENHQIYWAGNSIIDPNDPESPILVAAVDARWLLEFRDEMMRNIIISAAIIYPLVIVASYLIAGVVTRPMDLLVKAAETIEKDQPYDPALLASIEKSPDQLGTLARTFNSMAAQVKQRETVLKEQLKRLEIQIDMSKQKKMVEEITDNDFFRDLQAKKAALKERAETPSDLPSIPPTVPSADS